MSFHYTRAEDGIVTVTMDMQGQSANTMNGAWHALIRDTVLRLEAEVETGLRGVILTSAKKTFFAGGDLKSLMAMDRADDAFAANLALEKSYLRRLERLPVPVVAAINGAALGGGLEICLACHHRILSDHPAAITGLPEVTLGLLPGAGGVVRLPRLIGLEPALALLLSGRALAPAEALSLGVVDALCPPGADLVAAARVWIREQTRAPRQPWDRGPIEATTDADAATAETAMTQARRLIADARADVQARTRGKQPAPLRIIEIVEAGLALDFDPALAFETRHFLSLLGLPETRAGISLNFFAANAIRSGKRRPAAPRAPVARFALCGDDPVGERLAALARKRGIERVDRLADLVIDATRGDGPDAGLPLAPGGLVLSTQRLVAPGSGAEPLRALGWHLFAGMPSCRLAEIVAPPDAVPEAVARAYDFALQLRLTPVIVTPVAARPGSDLGPPPLFSRRLFDALHAECLTLVAEGLTPEDIETAMLGAGFTLAPFAAARALGLPPPQSPPADRRSPAERDAEERLIAVLVIETLTCLADRLVQTEAEADLASVLALGFPAHLGGALRYVRGLGPDAFLHRTARLAQLYGPRFVLDPDTLAFARSAAQDAA